MAISASTANTLSDWYTKATAGSNPVTPTAAATTANTGSVFGTTAAAKPVTATTPAATGAAATASAITGTAKTPSATTAGSGNYDVAGWYRQMAGREADAGGKAYWEGRLTAGEDSGALYNEFVATLAKNNDLAKAGGSKTLAPAQLDLNTLVKRDVDNNQTVSGQIGSLLDANSDYLQSARDRSMRASNARGLSNSSIAASAGEAAAYESALPIATADAKTYSDVNAYNAALMNQGIMYNTDAQNTFTNNQLQLDANQAINTANNATSVKNNTANNDTSIRNTDANNATSITNNAANNATAVATNTANNNTSIRNTDATNSTNLATNAANNATSTANNAANNANQLTVSQLQAETSRYQADRSNASSQYNTDANVKNQAEQNKTTLVNNIIQSTELSPDRKAELLKQLGENGLASAIFVGRDVANDLDFSNGY